MVGILNDLTVKKPNMRAGQELGSSLRKRMTSVDSSSGDAKIARTEESSTPIATELSTEDTQSVVPVETGEGISESSLEASNVPSNVVAVTVNERRSNELGAEVISRIMLEVLKHISESEESSETTIARLKSAENSFLAEIANQPHLAEEFDTQWLWHFACAFHMADRRRKHDLFRGILDYGAEKDQKNGQQEHTWIGKLFNNLVLQNDRDVVRAHRDAANAVDRKQYHRYQLELRRYQIELPAFDEPASNEETPAFDEDELILPKWLANFFANLGWPQWREILESPWRKVELVLKSFGGEIGLTKIENIYIISLVFLKIGQDSSMWEHEISVYQPEDDSVDDEETTEEQPSGDEPSLERDAPPWMKPLMHARYIQWRRQYECMLHSTRRANIPPLAYSRVMGMMSYGRLVSAQPSMAMQKLYQHFWTLENPNLEYLKILRKLDVMDHVNEVMNTAKELETPPRPADDTPAPTTWEPSLTLDTCAYLSKILETSLLPIRDAPVRPARLPTLQLN